jgi:hypothetical protein
MLSYKQCYEMKVDHYILKLDFGQFKCYLKMFPFITYKSLLESLEQYFDFHILQTEIGSFIQRMHPILRPLQTLHNKRIFIR